MKPQPTPSCKTITEAKMFGKHALRMQDKTFRLKNVRFFTETINDKNYVHVVANTCFKDDAKFVVQIDPKNPAYIYNKDKKIFKFNPKYK